MPRNRIGVGCQACRIRHTKCDNKQPSCRSCENAGIECVRKLKLRFRNGLGAESHDAPFKEQQPWMETAMRLEYHDETPQIIKSYEESSPTHASDGQASPGSAGARDANNGGATVGALIMAEVLEPSVTFDGPSSVLQPVQASPTTFQGLLSPDSGRLGAGVLLDTPPPTALYRLPPSPALPHKSQCVPLDQREAILMRHFIESMACWADITDLTRTFEIEVPRRALYHPILRYAVFAFSSRHINRDAPGDSAEALEYYDECLKLLITTIPAPEEQISEEVFAACGILRQYEEQDLDDHMLHLTGATRMLNSMSPFDFSGGLGEAAAWLCLRQDIAVAMALHRPLRTNLDNFFLSDIFQRNDDAAWASRMIFLLAQVLSCSANMEDQPVATTARLASIGQDVDEWYASKPATFDPIKHEYSDKHGLPEIWMLAPFHAVGLQYYYIAKIVLELCQSRAPKLGYSNLRESRRIENNVRKHLLCALGLSSSNPRAENLLFTARHALAAWGGIFREPREQDAVHGFLDQIQQRTGWNMSHLRSTLREQWDEDR